MAAAAVTGGPGQGGRRRLAARLGWALFGLLVAGLFTRATLVARASPRPTASADLDGKGVRFGLTEARRRAIYLELMRGEKENREAGEKNKEGLIWNRNHDSYFHQHEWPRIVWWSRTVGVPEWQAWLILDEGIRGHWPMPPGIPLLADEAPLLPVTRPLAQRPVIVPAPEPPRKSDAAGALPATTALPPATAGPGR